MNLLIPLLLDLDISGIYTQISVLTIVRLLIIISSRALDMQPFFFCNWFTSRHFITFKKRRYYHLRYLFDLMHV